MPFSSLLPFLLFAFVASITPGPTNLLVLSNSTRFGIKAALPIIFGASASAATLVLVVASGLGQSISAMPLFKHTLQWAGIAWLTCLAWKIFSAPVTAPLQANSQQPRLGLWGAASLQWVNPKSWMMALAVVSVFLEGPLIELNPKLAKYEFFKKLAAWQAFQELSMFLGNLAAPDKTTVQLSEKDRINQHGFDNWSFRTRSQAR